jgi:hypothetical protein
MLLFHAWALMAATSSVLCVAVAPQVAAVVVLGGDTDDGGGEDALLLLRLAAQEVRRYTYATGGEFPTIQHLRTPDARQLLRADLDEPNSTSAVVIGTAAAATTLFHDDGGAAGGDGPDVTPDVLITAAAAAGSLIGADRDVHTMVQLTSGVTLLLGATPLAVLYAAYEYAATHLGVYFAIDGDRIPRRSRAGVDRSSAYRRGATHRQQPLFARRGAVPYHDFPMGPVRRPTVQLHQPRFAIRGVSWFTAYPMGQDWWSADDYKAFSSQLVKLKMNTIATHTYAVEPTVWVGTAANLSSSGRIVGGVYNTTPWFRAEFPPHCIGCDSGNSVWGLVNRSTSDYTCGSGQFFPTDNFGSPLSAAYPTKFLPSQAQNIAAFEGAADLLKDAFGFSRNLGVEAAVGVEVPLGVTYPWANGKEREHFEGIFTRLKKLKFPLSQFWLYSSEGSMNAGVNSSSPSVQRIVKDAHTAVAALAKVWPEGNVTIGMSGWMLGPPDQPAYFDKVGLPKEVGISTLDPNVRCHTKYASTTHPPLPCSDACVAPSCSCSPSCMRSPCCSHSPSTRAQVGWAPVDPGWAQVTTPGRSKILIPWAEDDPGLAGPELWVERILDHAAVGNRYGCTGLLAVHWRTQELVPEFAAMHSAAWATAPNATDVYAEFAKAEFGAEVSEEMTQIFLSLDSFAAGVNLSSTSYPTSPTRLPRVSQECCGKFTPCTDMPIGPSHGHCKADSCNSFIPNATCPPVKLNFVAAFEAVASRVRGAANKARFNKWYKSFLYFSQVVDVELAATKLNEAMVNVSKPNTTAAEKKQILAAALPKLKILSRAWERMTTSLQETVLSAGTLGTLATNDANMYVRDFPFNSTVAQLLAAGMEVPHDALPARGYLGPDRLFVRTVRTVVLRQEGHLTISPTFVTKVLTPRPELTLHWRNIRGTYDDDEGTPGGWHTLHPDAPPTSGRGVFSFTLAIPHVDFEWYVSEKRGLVFPPGFADEKETVTVVVL